MNITYNNLGSPSNLLTFTEIPNILKVIEYADGTKATFIFTFNDGLQATVSADTQYYVSFLGESVSNVMDAKKAQNKRFYIGYGSNSTAASFAAALRNCGGIAADFDIIVQYEQVFLRAKTIGQKWSNIPNYFQTNIPSAYLETSASDGSVFSSFLNSKIQCDVFSASSFDLGSYITTLEKNFYGNECAFDVSPVLATFSEYGKTKPYFLKLTKIAENGEVEDLQGVSGNTAIGYQANQSDKYKYATGANILINTNRNTLLYTYSNTIDYSVLCGQDTGGWTLRVSCKDSAFNEIFSTGTTNQRTSSNYIVDTNFTVPTNIFSNSYYIDMSIGDPATDVDTFRFKVIKPLKATEYCQRVYWRNEYGGLSFFDFTGSRSESDSVDIDTYEKNIFDYHESNEFERKKIYANNYKKSVSLSSHLIEENGKWIFNSLMKSKKVWTIINGKTYYIIPTNVDVVEDQTYNNIYKVTLTYEYSDI